MRYVMGWRVVCSCVRGTKEQRDLNRRMNSVGGRKYKSPFEGK